MSSTTPFTFAEAASRQHLYGSYYTVWLISPAGDRVYLGMTKRKSGTGLVNVLRRDAVQDLIRTLPDAETATFTKSSTGLAMSNGYAIRFGGTIRQESSAV